MINLVIVDFFIIVFVYLFMVVINLFVKFMRENFLVCICFCFVNGVVGLIFIVILVVMSGVMYYVIK